MMYVFRIFHAKNYCLLYLLLKYYSRLVFPLWCRSLTINKPEILKHKGPFLLACNHPNSFWDGVFLDTIFQQPIWSLARGDVFVNKPARFFLNQVKILPVYRTSEGVENISSNYHTFDTCIEHFKRQGCVLIFIEGRCINEWKLRPLMKGTARLSIAAWEQGVPLHVIPVGINFSSFRTYGKSIDLRIGNIVTSDIVADTDGYGNKIKAFNHTLQAELSELVYEKNGTHHKELTALQEKQPSTTIKLLAAIPAGLGIILYAPLYMLAKTISDVKSNNDHYDSVLHGILLLTYPFYILLLTWLAYSITHLWYAWLLIFLLPLCAWGIMQFIRSDKKEYGIQSSK